MHRRDFLALTAATCALPLAAVAAPIEYRPGLLQQRLDAGDTVFLDFTADWCSTCRAQERVLTKLKSENPAYEAHITFIDVNWDIYGSAQIATNLNIPRRSTLVVLKGDQELGRIIAQTRESTIRALLDTALAAAMSA